MDKKVGIAIGIIGIGVAVLPYILEALGVKLSQPLLYFLLSLSAIMIVGGFGSIVWLLRQHFQRAIQTVRQIWLNIRRLRVILKPVQDYKDIGTRFILKAPEEERALLNFYEVQKANWKSYIRLELVHVVPKVTGDSPKITFQLVAHNYLPDKFKLVKVTHSSGTVSAGALGSCDLPQLPETIDHEVGSCSEKQFTIDLAVNGTNVPRFLQSPKVSAGGQLLQWMLKGEWYVEIYSKTEVWQYQSYEIRYDQVVRI